MDAMDAMDIDKKLTLHILFWALVCLQILPFWVVASVPTTDGPSHVYNAWILREHLNTGDHPLLSHYYDKYYEIDHTPLPNWLGHAALALLMTLFAPSTAEKVLVSGYVVLFLAGALSLAGAVDPGRRWLAFLAFPLVFNRTFQLGFYNFGMSLGFFLLALGFWWRRRGSPGAGLAVGINLILLLCWFSHIVSTVMALLGIGVLWLCTLRRGTWKRHLLHVAILAPQVALPLWFVTSHAAQPVPSQRHAELLWRYFRRLEVLYTFSKGQIVLGSSLAALFLLLVVLTLAGRRAEGRPALREEDGFLLLAVLAFVIYCASPEGMTGGSLLRARLSLYPWLFLLPWLAPWLVPWLPERLAQPARAALIAVLALVAAGNAGAHARWWRAADREVQAFLAATRGIEPGTRVLPILYDHRASIGLMGTLDHAFSRAATEKCLIDWSNYEAATDHFPVRLRASAPRINGYVLAAMPWSFNVREHRDEIDYVFAWKVPPGSPLARRLRRSYVLVSEEGPARLYENPENLARARRRLPVVRK
jgi:hypothetical protein